MRDKTPKLVSVPAILLKQVVRLANNHLAVVSHALTNSKRDDDPETIRCVQMQFDAWERFAHDCEVAERD